MKILLIEDHKLLRDSLKHYLGHTRPDIKVDEANSLEEGLKQLSKKSGIELILLDLNLPDSKGLNGIDIIKKSYPKIPIVVLSAKSDSQTILNAIDRGAVGFIPKELSGRVLVRALDLVMEGEIFIPSKAIEENRLYSKSSAIDQQKKEETLVFGRKLTSRELQVLELLVLGKTNKEISNYLDIKQVTVGYHLKGLFWKFEATNRTEVAAKALQLGFGNPANNDGQ